MTAPDVNETERLLAEAPRSVADLTYLGYVIPAALIESLCAKVRELQSELEDWKAAYERNDKTGISKADAAYLTMRLGEAAESDKALKTERDDAQGEAKRLAGHLKDCTDDLEDAASYMDSYFYDKYSMDETIAKYRALTAHQPAKGPQC